jgi:hypothetical protein
MSEDIPDYSAFKEQSTIAPGGNLMGALVALADEQEAAQAEVERLELLLDEAKKNLQRITEHEIPKLMDGIEGKLNLPDGRTITISEKIRASITSDKKPLAFGWLNENGHGALIKRRFIIEFGRDQEEWAKEFEKQLGQSKTPLNVKKEENVHWQTLDAFVREQLGEGSDLPLDLFGVFRQRFSKIKGAN